MQKNLTEGFQNLYSLKNIQMKILHITYLKRKRIQKVSTMITNQQIIAKNNIHQDPSQIY